ncbi:glycosyltransferase [Arthrobacter sp. AET 35A]|nr:glycosyltransferase [Arthrobacter sp. AET 35A]
MIEVAKVLRENHKCVFLGYEPDFFHLITAAGFRLYPLEPVWSDVEKARALALDQGRGVRNPFTLELVRRRVSAERQLIRDTGAVAVIHGTNLTSLISSRAEKVPLFYPVPFALTRSHVSQTRTGLLAVPRRIEPTFMSVFRTLYNSAPLVPRAFTVVARENGVTPLRSMASMFEADHNLLTVMQWELDAYSLPAGYERVGPIYAQLPGDVPDCIHELASSTRPLVYLALGSSASRRLALSAIHSLGSLPVNVVAPLRHYLTNEDLKERPGNVTVTGLLPAHQLGKFVDAAVLHGGQGTVQTACATGIPFVGMGLQPEQRWNVSVCERLGNAISIRPRQICAPLFGRAVRRTLEDPAIRDAADRVKRAYAGENGAAAVAAVVERVVASRK